MLEEARIKAAQKNQDERLTRRLDYAGYLLTQTAESVEKIAAKCGWLNEKAFTRAFQKQIGVTPAHYRNWHQN